MPPTTQSLWYATHQLRRFPARGAADLRASGEPDVIDAVIVGGGITGLTAALLQARAGRQVVLLEQERIGAGETGRTTSHLTEAVDGRYQTIRRTFGVDGARLVAQSSRAALDRIEQFVRDGAIECAFERVPGYLYSERKSDLDWLATELDAAHDAGCAAVWVDRLPLPFATAGGICWPGQAQIHAMAYLSGLVEELVGLGVRLFEGTRVTNVHDGEPCIVHTDGGDLRAREVFVAAHVPVINRVAMHTKIAAYRSYAMAMTPIAGVGPGLFWDTDDPYHYTRLHRVNGRQYLIVGGEDHRTGEEDDTEARYETLGEYVRARFGDVTADYRWSGQIIEPVDGLPYIGLNTAAGHVYVATGYSGNGMTFGTLAGMIVSDLMSGQPNPYAELYDATRIKPVASAASYVAENVLFPTRLVTDRLTSADVQEGSIDELRAGEGGIFAGEDGKVAVCRDRQGVLHARSAVCTHLGCDVDWNSAEQSWDCPCHGSRFAPDGRVINGPAVTDLPPARVPTTR